MPHKTLCLRFKERLEKSFLHHFIRWFIPSRSFGMEVLDKKMKLPKPFVAQYNQNSWGRARVAIYRIICSIQTPHHQRCWSQLNLMIVRAQNDRLIKRSLRDSSEYVSQIWEKTSKENLSKLWIISSTLFSDCLNLTGMCTVPSSNQLPSYQTTPSKLVGEFTQQHSLAHHAFELQSIQVLILLLLI